MLGESIGPAKSALVESDAKSKEINLYRRQKSNPLGLSKKHHFNIIIFNMLATFASFEKPEANQKYQKQKDNIDLQGRELQTELSVLEGKKDELEFIRKFSSEVRKLHQPF